MEQKSKNGVSIIGGADGPTSIFIAGHSKKQPLKIRIKNSIYRYKRKKVEKTIVANPHSLSETVQYAKDKYELTETAPADREYIEQIKCLKESLILQYEPELLGEMKDIPVPDFSNEASVKEYLGKIKTRSEMIAEMPDSIISMDFHLYKIEINDKNIENNLEKINVDLKINSDGENEVYLNGENVTDKIRTEEVSMAASNVSKNSKVREHLVQKQRALAGTQSVVIEGRDAATVIFPNADIKLFFTSNIDIRSSRRYNDLKKKDSSVKLENVKNDLIKRDTQDSTRTDSPLKKAKGSILIDTSNCTVEETTNSILDILRERIGLI